MYDRKASGLLAVTALCSLTVSCGLPPFESEGEHVVVATEIVPEVCAGTLAVLDEGVERVDRELGLPAPNERLKVAILAHEEAKERCPIPFSSCARQVGPNLVAIVSARRFELAATHELGHLRLGNYRSGTLRVFSEGLAVAVAPALCEPKNGGQKHPDKLLAAGPEDDFDQASYYASGELVTWLLDEHGPEQVLEFVGTTRRPEALAAKPDPDTVRSNYLAAFGTAFDDDLYAHDRDPEQLSSWEVGCVAPELDWDGRRTRLRAELSCDSARVVNNFRAPELAYVEWTMTTREGEDRLRLLDELPPDTTLTLTPCKCTLALRKAAGRWDDGSPVGSTIELEPGSYRVRWQGPLDSEHALDLRLEAHHLAEADNLDTG